MDVLLQFRILNSQLYQSSISLSRATMTRKILNHTSHNPILNTPFKSLSLSLSSLSSFIHSCTYKTIANFTQNHFIFMATTKLLHPPILDSHFSPLIFRAMNITTKLQPYHHHGINSKTKAPAGFGDTPLKFRLIITKVAEQSHDLLGDDTLSHTKASLYQALQGINRGIFGVPSDKKSEIEALVKQLESQNPTPDPTLQLNKVDGCWRLVYSTITILGSKRTKLGLRDFISLDDFLQIIDLAKSKAINIVKFSAKGLSLLKGQLSIEASFTIASSTRVLINYESSSIVPDQLMDVFRKNYDVLLGIFNPQGWLDITYVDDSLRIGRDDKGNIFVLERFQDYNT